MLTGVLYPSDTGRLLVVLRHSSPPEDVFSVLKNTGGWLVEKIDGRTFVVESKALGFGKKLYENGAFLVLNGDADYGCNTPQVSKIGAVKYENPYRKL